MKNVAIYCSSSKVSPRYSEEIARFAGGLGSRGWNMVYGGGLCGLMGDAADAALAGGSEVLGVITDYLAAMREVMHPGLTETIVVKDLFERKQIMMERSDMFVIFPGGLGTLDELLEVLTWKQLGQLDKPILVVSIDGFWQPLQDMIGFFKEQKMVRESDQSLYHVVESADEALQWMEKELAK